ncbi:MAG: hypothetical protein JNK85_07910, partial [Verrucomicrobiales bacterium]|nr:hypothetical protein [Verrucomicrobiales bacterium]
MDLQPGSSRADRRKKISRVVVGSVTVRIYHGINQVAGRDYPQHTVVYHETDGRRVRRRFNDLADAKQEAEQIAMRLSRRQASILSLSDDDRAFYAQATELLKPFNKPLNLAVEEYVGALRLLPPGVRLHDAVAEFANRFRQVRETKPIPSLVTEFIASKEKAGLSDRHLADLKSRLVPFAEAFGIPPNELTGPALQEYLDGMRKSSRTRLNHWRHIVTMLRWSVRRKLAPRELLEELEAVERPRVESGAIGIWKPAEFAEILEATRHFRPDLLAWITLAG